MLARTHGLIQSYHLRNAILECKAIADSRKDTREAMERMKEFLISRKYIPERMTENTCFIYDPKNRHVTSTMEAFWNEYLDQHITYRDQPLWALIRQEKCLSYFSIDRFSEHFHKSQKPTHHVYVPR